MVSTDQTKTPDSLSRLLKDPEVKQEIKEACFKFMENPILEQKITKTPANCLFAICHEYNKYPDIYDDIISGKIKFFLKGLMENALPVLHHKKVKEHEDLNKIFGPNSILNGVIERFAICDFGGNIVRRITVRVKKNEMMTAAFNAQNQIISMLIDTIENKPNRNDFLDLINSTENKRIDLLRI